MKNNNILVKQLKVGAKTNLLTYLHLCWIFVYFVCFLFIARFHCFIWMFEGAVIGTGLFLHFTRGSRLYLFPSAACYWNVTQNEPCTFMFIATLITDSTITTYFTKHSHLTYNSLLSNYQPSNEARFSFKERTWWRQILRYFVGLIWWFFFLFLGIKLSFLHNYSIKVW